MVKRNPRKMPERDLTHEAEVLHAKVRMDGRGEDPVVKAMLSDEFLTMPDSEAGKIALMLQELVRGQHSLLANQDTMSDRIAKLEEQWTAYDQHAKEWEADKERFFEERWSKAQRTLEVSPAQQEVMRAKAATDLQQAISAARVRNSVSQLQFAADLANMPKETVVSPGVWENRAVQGRAVPTLIPEIVRIKDRVWVLKPNEPTVVPKIVADILRQRRKSEQEIEERKSAFRMRDDGSIPSQIELARKLGDINKRYGGGDENDLPPVPAA